MIEFLNNTIELLEERSFLKYDDEDEKKLKKFSVGNGVEMAKLDDYVVHIDHGIGIFKGIVQLARSGLASNVDYFKIEYASPKNSSEPDTLFVPLEQKKKIHLHLGLKNPTIHRLGGSTIWHKTKKKAKEDIIKFANELLKSWRKRGRTVKDPFSPDSIENVV